MGICSLGDVVRYVVNDVVDYVGVTGWMTWVVTAIWGDMRYLVGK